MDYLLSPDLQSPVTGFAQNGVIGIHITLPLSTTHAEIIPVVNLEVHF